VKDNNSNGHYFFTSLTNGADCVFDAIDDIIKFNQSIEEKTRLLKTKAQELKELFETEDIEKLRTLTFTFVTNDVKTETEDETTKKEGKKNNKGNKGKKGKDKKNKAAEEAPVTPTEEEPVKEEKAEVEEEQLINNKNVEGDSLLDFANDIIEN
jgi:hypothetical protein